MWFRALPAAQQTPYTRQRDSVSPDDTAQTVGKQSMFRASLRCATHNVDDEHKSYDTAA